MQVLPGLESGGVERGTIEVARALVGHGHASVVVSAGGRLVPELEAQGSVHHTRSIHRKNPASFFQILPFRQLLREERPDILHLRSRLPGWIARLAWKGLPREERPKLVTTVHGLYSPNRWSAVMTCGEKVICVSESVRRYVREHYPKVPADRLVVIPRGIDPQEFPYGYQPNSEWLRQWKTEYPQLEGALVITLPGRVTRLKGHHAFLRIVQKLRQTGLPVQGIVVGETHPRKQNYARELRQEADALGLSGDLVFTGGRSDIREVLAISDVVLSLNEKPEAFGRTTLEALALGRPVLGYDSGGVGEILSLLFPEGKVPPGDTEAVAARLMKWKFNPPLPKPNQPFTLERMLKETLGLYQSILNPNVAPNAAKGALSC